MLSNLQRFRANLYLRVIFAFLIKIEQIIMIRFFWCLLCFVALPFLTFGQDLDSIPQRQIRTGVHASVENISEFVLRGNNGFGFEIGAFQERKLLDKVFFSFEGGVRFKSYSDEPILVDSTRRMLMPVPDTAFISDFYSVSHNDLKITSLASMRFVYLEDPNVYFIIGLGPEVTIRQIIEPEYLSTRFADTDGTLIGESTRQPPILDDDEFRKSSLNLRIDLGVGIELKKFNIELVHRTDNTENLGLRIRYTFNTLTY